MTTNYPSDPNWPELSKSFPSMTAEQLRESKFKLQDEILSIAHQLDMAFAMEKNGGEAPNPTWVAKANMARNARQRYVNEIEERLAIKQQEANA